MTKHELQEALAIARDHAAELNLSDLDVFDGFALPDFPQIYCTRHAVAMLIRWQCFYIGGGVDQAALDEIARCGRQKFQIV